MAGEEGAREEQMSVRDLKLDTKDDEGGEGEAQRQKRLSDKATEAQMAKKKKQMEKRALKSASKLHVNRRRERQNG